MGTTQDQSTFIATSFVLENTGVHAYLGQATQLKNKDLLAAAASIVTVEAPSRVRRGDPAGQRPVRRQVRRLDHA